MSFSNLQTVIGLAPSELPRAELLQRLSNERDRVRRSIIFFRQQLQKKKAPAKRAKSKLGAKMKQANVSVEQLAKALAQLEKERR